MLKVPKSPELKLARGYSDPKSFVRDDGSEVLYGKDWKMRVNVELFLRCGGRCEHEQPWKVWPLGGPAMERCTNDAEDPHHRIPRSKGRDDRLENLQALCRYHHNLLDKRKVKWSKP
jgi:hypothetical protein